MILTPFHRTREDAKKAKLYESILRDNPDAQITPYSVLQKQKTSWIKNPLRLIHGQSLEEKLFQCVVDWENASTEKAKKAIDLRALGYIKRCCKGELSFIKDGIRFYREIQNGVFYIT